jgi:FKBP-type peptidyl-prolyl cis-trans isomerase
MKKYLWLALVIAAGVGVLLLLSWPGAADGTLVTTKSGLKYQDLKVGDGPEAKAGDSVLMQYTGWLTPDGTTKGKKFDSSLDHPGGDPLPFTIGRHKVIAGWDEGAVGMKVGGKRRLIVSPELGYGAAGFPPDIPPNATLLFEVELIKIQ